MRTQSIPSLVFTEHRFQLPVDYANPNAYPPITVFAREVVAPGNENANLPFLVFFQGGPGFGAPRPTAASGWLKRALREFRVLLLDQRGTGLSSPITAQTMRHFASSHQQADYISHFRCDNIVRDAEAIRAQLIGATQWSILGQSFGGFCALRYLCAAPEALKEVLITGGIPSLTATADDVYRATYPRVIVKNERYYARYPGDVARVREIVQFLADNEILMPSGGRCTPQRFLQLGMALGMSDGFEMLHHMVEDAFVSTVKGREIHWNFLSALEAEQAFDSNPIYTLLQEACYTQNTASNWSAERLLGDFPAFSLNSVGSAPILFTGEMVYPWMLDTYPQLQPLKDAANLLATKTDWPMLYDVERLRNNTVPIAAAVYYDDMYVPREFSEATAQAVPNMRLWITNEYEHNGLRADGERVVDRLLSMLRGAL